MLFQLGTVTFEVVAPNITEWDRRTNADYAQKDTMGNMRPLEFMGVGDEAIQMVGVLYPHTLGGLSTTEELDRLRDSGNAQILTRGDGKNMGWFVILGFDEKHRTLDVEGVGKKIEFLITLQRSPKPSAAAYLPTLLRLFGQIFG